MQCTQRALARRCDRNLGLSRQQRSSRATVDLKAVAAAVPHGVGQHQTEMASAVDAQDGPLDHGLEAFKSLIAERRFFCTQCGKCCTGVNGRAILVPAPHKLHTCDCLQQLYSLYSGTGTVRCMHICSACRLHWLESAGQKSARHASNTSVCGAVGDGEVWITDEEAERIAAHLGLSLQRFCLQYTRAYSKVQGFKLLRAQNNPVGAVHSWLGRHQDQQHAQSNRTSTPPYATLPCAEDAGCSKIVLACDIYARAGQQGSKELNGIMLQHTLTAWCEHVSVWQANKYC